MRKKRYIATAWPYANGSPHLGHIAGILGGDILARYFRMKGDEVLFVSGSDCHGTPISVEAEKQKISPKEIAEKYHKEFSDTLLSGLSFSYDTYTTTMTENHKKVVQEMFLKLLEKGLIYKQTDEFPFCETCNRFLPDRYVEGECPFCGFKDARGDQCDECGRLLDPFSLVGPRCKTCRSTPIKKSSEHFYLKLSAFQEDLKAWVARSIGWRENALRSTEGLLLEGLKDRAITRDIEWGVPVPIDGYEGKRIYVWFEAVCGYLSASIEWAEKKGNKDAWKAFWEDHESTHYYIFGKDNIPFHTVIWPAMLMGHGYLHLPDKIFASEYLTIGRRQFSKSRKWAVWVPEFLAVFPGDMIRYFLSVYGPESADADFSWGEFQTRMNGELIGNFGNFIHRTLSQIVTNFPDGASYEGKKLNSRDEEIFHLIEHVRVNAGTAIEEGKFREALRSIIGLAEEGNRYLNETAPWKSVKTDKEDAEKSLAISGELIRAVSHFIDPFMPVSGKKIREMIGEGDACWEYEIQSRICPKDITPLFARIENDVIEKEKEKLTTKK